jgi:hypothetical protein
VIAVGCVCVRTCACICCLLAYVFKAHSMMPAVAQTIDEMNELEITQRDTVMA